MSSSQTDRRLVENEILARTSNRKAGNAIANLSVKINSIIFFCECSNQDCRERIPMSLPAYTKIHEQNNRFMVKPDHATSSVESVVDKSTNYWIVQKIEMSGESA